MDDSPSHEADTLIASLTRTSKPGLVDDAERLAVITTRTRLIRLLWDLANVEGWMDRAFPISSPALETRSLTS